jgi:hypothetical protein
MKLNGMGHASTAHLKANRAAMTPRRTSTLSAPRNIAIRGPNVKCRERSQFGRFFINCFQTRRIGPMIEAGLSSFRARLIDP